MLRHRLQSLAAVTAVAAVALSATANVASAKRPAKTFRAHAGLAVHHVSTPTAVAMEAFPTGGKGSGTEEECHQWTIWLNEDLEAYDQATTTVDMINTADQLKADIDAAMDAGCAVID